MNSKTQSVNDARKYITGELSGLYPDTEIISLLRIILTHATGKEYVKLFSGGDNLISASDWDKISKICADLKQYKPIQYIIGETEFYGLRLKVNKHTLIPRQETEEMVHLIVRENMPGELKVLDIGTGSGAIAISLAINLKNPVVTATDISANALAVAGENAFLNGCKIIFIHDDICKPAIGRNEIFDIIVSNPPYVRESEKQLMSKNVLAFEPGISLFVPDSDPLKYYRPVLDFADTHLTTGGKVYLEINEVLGKEMVTLTGSHQLTSVRLHKDINGKDRIITAVKA